MKHRINQKGLGHHILLIVVAVVAVVGASGYFVWQRQKDTTASAATLAYISRQYTGINYPYGIQFYGCRNSGASIQLRALKKSTDPISAIGAKATGYSGATKTFTTSTSVPIFTLNIYDKNARIELYYFVTSASGTTILKSVKTPYAYIKYSGLRTC